MTSHIKFQLTIIKICIEHQIKIIFLLALLSLFYVLIKLLHKALVNLLFKRPISSICILLLGIIFKIYISSYNRFTTDHTWYIPILVLVLVGITNVVIHIILCKRENKNIYLLSLCLAFIIPLIIYNFFLPIDNTLATLSSYIIKFLDIDCICCIEPTDMTGQNSNTADSAGIIPNIIILPNPANINTNNLASGIERELLERISRYSFRPIAPRYPIQLSLLGEYQSIHQVPHGMRLVPGGFMEISLQFNGYENQVSRFIPHGFVLLGQNPVYDPNNFRVNRDIGSMFYEYRHVISETFTRANVGDEVWDYIQTYRDFIGENRYLVTGRATNKLITDLNDEIEIDR